MPAVSDEPFAPGYPIPGKTLVFDESDTIDLDSIELDGGLLVKILNLSIDPYLRRRMADSAGDSEESIVSARLNIP